jgi:hypothetical protein
MRPASHTVVRWPAVARDDFQRFELGSRLLYLHRDFAHAVSGILTAVSNLHSRQGRGNRLSGVPITLEDGTALYARIGRRGGLIGMMLKDLYVGTHVRPVRELRLTAEARRRGIPVAEPIGAIVERVGPVLYRSIFLTRALPGMTLWQFLTTDDDRLTRAYVVERARKAIDTMHRAGLFHADLNLHNLFVTPLLDDFGVFILDLDKARFFEAPLHPRMRARNLARLRRSALKLDPDGSYLDSRLLQSLTDDRSGPLGPSSGGSRGA